MPIIIIASDSNETGEEIARETARTLDYSLLGRDLLPGVASRCGIPQDQLERALETTPRPWGGTGTLSRRALASIQAAVLEALLRDNVVCHGLAAHLYVVGISHALRVRILEDTDSQRGEGSKPPSIPIEQARILRDRRNTIRRRWSMGLYQRDETDPSFYDLVIHLSRIPPDEAVKVIAQTVAHRRFAPMTYSLKCLRDAELAARVLARLLETFPKIKVRADGGTVIVETRGTRFNKLKKAAAIKSQVQGMEGVDYVEVHVKNGLLKKSEAGFA